MATRTSGGAATRRSFGKPPLPPSPNVGRLSEGSVKTPTGIPGSERAAKKRPSSERKVSFSDNVDIQTYSKRAPASDITPTSSPKMKRDTPTSNSSTPTSTPSLSTFLTSLEFLGLLEDIEMTDSQQEMLTSKDFSSSVEKILLRLENEDSQQQSTPPRTPTLSRLLNDTAMVDSPYKPPQKSITIDEFLKSYGITFPQIPIRKPSRSSTSSSSSKSRADRIRSYACDSPLKAFYHFACEQLEERIEKLNEEVRTLENTLNSHNPLIFSDSSLTKVELIKLKELCKRDSHDAWYEWRSLCCEGIQEGIGCEEISVKFLELEENFQLLKSDCEQIGEMRKRNEKLREGLKTDVKMHLPMRYPVNEDTDEMSNLRQCGSNKFIRQLTNLQNWKLITFTDCEITFHFGQDFLLYFTQDIYHDIHIKIIKHLHDKPPSEFDSLLYNNYNLSSLLDQVKTCSDIPLILQQLSIHIGRLQAFEKELKFLSRSLTLRRLVLSNSCVLEIEFSSKFQGKFILHCILPKGKSIYDMDIQIKTLWGNFNEISQEINRVPKVYGRLLFVCKRIINKYLI